MFSSATPAQIKDSPLNTSSAKNQWSFSKSPRFKDPKPYCQSSSYEKKSSLSNRRASIGYGNRSKFFEGNKTSIDPGRYEILSDFDLKNAKKKGHSFNCNRDELVFSNYLTIGQKTPSPLTYSHRTSFNKKQRCYSMREKTNYPKNYFLFSQVEEERKKQEPGPGRYQTIDQIGSKYRSSKCTNGGRTSFIGKQRFVNEKNTPGPGDYQAKGIEPDGKYLLSTMKGSGRRAILAQKRELKLKGNKFTPGPGAYRLQSDFGHYDKKVRPNSARK